MRTRSLGIAVAAAAVLVGAPAHADEAGLTMTPEAVQALSAGQLTVAPLGPANEVAPGAFSMPVANVAVRPSGSVRAITMSGGLTISDAPSSLDLTKFRVNVPAQVASVRTSLTPGRVRAFDVVRVKVTKKKVKGVLLIAPGAASVLNEEFDTYVFSDGLRFARFVYPR